MAKVKFFKDEVVAKVRFQHLNKFYQYLNAGDYLISKIKAVIFSGQSPVAGESKYQKYSKSYIDYLEGKVRFYTINGKVVPSTPKYKTLKSGKVSTKRDTFEKPFPNKKKSPVNLYATGEMMNTLALNKVASQNHLVVGFFGSKIAQYHDRLGASKKKIIRRLLPTRQGEKFKSNINILVKQSCKQALKDTLIDNKLALSIRFVLSTRR